MHDNFRNVILLTGAGFTKSFGVYNKPQLNEIPVIKDAMNKWSEPHVSLNFEDIYSEVLGDRFVQRYKSIGLSENESLARHEHDAGAFMDIIEDVYFDMDDDHIKYPYLIKICPA